LKSKANETDARQEEKNSIENSEFSSILYSQIRVKNSKDRTIFINYVIISGNLNRSS
jgi:hypothetical protein